MINLYEKWIELRKVILIVIFHYIYKDFHIDEYLESKFEYILLNLWKHIRIFNEISRFYYYYLNFRPHAEIKHEKMGLKINLSTTLH